MVQTVKFSQFATASLNDSSRTVVGTATGANCINSQQNTWTTSTRPNSPYDGLLGYNTTIEDWEYYQVSTSSWLSFAVSFPIQSATFILQTPSSYFPSAQALSILSTGILKSTTATGVLSISAPLTSIDGLTTIANEILYTTASNTYATTSITSLARSLLADSNTAQMQTTLGLGTSATKTATDNSQTYVASAKGSFTTGNVLIAGDSLGTVTDSGAPPVSGTVTSVAAGTGLNSTPNPIISTGTITLAPISSHDVLSNITSGTAIPSGNTLTALIDVAIAATQGDILYRNGSIWTALSPGTSGQVLQTGGSSANPAYSIATYPSSTTINQLLYSSSNNTITGLATANSSVLTTSGTGVPTWLSDLTVPLGGTGNSTFTAYSVICAGTTATGAFQNVSGLGTAGQVLTSQGAGALPHWVNAVGGGTVTSVATGTGLTGGTITTSGTISLDTIPNNEILSNITGSVAAPVPNALTAIIDSSMGLSQGDILYRNSSVWTVLGPGTSGQFLQTQGAAANPQWATPAGSGTVNSGTANQLAYYATSTNAVSGLTLGNYGVLISSSSGAPSWLANGTTGQVLTATTSGTPSWQNAAASSVTFTGDSGTPFSGAAVTVTGASTGLTFAASIPNLTLGGVLGLTNGGTNHALTASNGGIVYSDASKLDILAGTATANQILTSGSSSAPAWTGLSDLMDAILGSTQGDILYRNGTVWTVLAPGTSGNFLQTQGAAANPQWAAPSGSGTVNSGSINQLAWYAANGTAVSGLATANSGVLVTSAGGVPSISSTLPAFTTSSITFSPTTGGIVGTPTNDNAAAGKVGEVIASIIPFASAIPVTINTVTNITSISLTAGDWDVDGSIFFTVTAAVSDFQACISLTSATITDNSLLGQVGAQGVLASGNCIAPYQRISLSTTTTVYLVGTVFGVATVTACGFISARRAR